MEHRTNEDRLTARTYVSALTRIAFTTACYWLVGLTPEENHGAKGSAWARLRAYRWAAWHFRKYLKYTDDSWARAALAWCYAEMGLVESAVEHYRLAYARNKNPEIAIYLAHAEVHFGNLDAARRLYGEAAARRDELGSEALSDLAALDDRITCASSEGREHSDSGADGRNISLAELMRDAEFIGIVRVERIDRAIPFIRPRRVTAAILQRWKGQAEGTVSFLAATGMRNIPDARVGQEAIVFLRDGSLEHSGRGTMPVFTREGRRLAAIWPDVRLPSGVSTVDGPEPTYRFIRAFAVSDLRNIVDKLSLVAEIEEPRE